VNHGQIDQSVFVAPPAALDYVDLVFNDGWYVLVLEHKDPMTNPVLTSNNFVAWLRAGET
jgi:hypothetical protein